MTDIHSHILYGIDDGAKSLEESISILRKASELGYTKMILTPHYIKDTKYNANNKKKLELLNNLKKELQKEQIAIELYLGNEVFIDEDLVDLIGTDIATLNNTKYILIELPRHSKYLLVEEVLSNLIKNGYIPIIAHPERYRCYYKDYTLFKNLISMGVLLQGNIGSLFGAHGQEPRKMLIGLLKRDMISFMASDIHHLTSTSLNTDIYSHLLKIVKDEQKVKNLLGENADVILLNS